MKLITQFDIKKILGGFLTLAIMLGGCTNTLPITPTPPPTSNPATETAIPTRTVEVRPSPTATIPAPTETPQVDTLPTFTPGPPTATPVVIAYTPAPTECVRTLGATEHPVYLGDCVYWVDQHANESGFRIELRYDNSGEYFLYDVPANTVAFALPSEAAPRLDESLEQCYRRSSYQVLVYALFAQGPPVMVSGMAFSGECGPGEELPTATATVALPGAWREYADPALGFHLRYPAQWYLHSIPLDAAGGSVRMSTHNLAEYHKVPPENYFKIEVVVVGSPLREADQTLLDWWHAQADYDPAIIRQETDVQVAGVPALEVTTEARPGLFQKTVYLPYHHPKYGETVLFITCSSFTRPSDMEIFQQVVSSLTMDRNQNR